MVSLPLYPMPVRDMPAYCHPAAYDAFQRALAEVESTTGLFRAAFAIAQHEHPAADLLTCETILDDLAETVRRRVHSPSIDARLAHLHDLLFDIVGFVGNVEDYYNPANSYIPEVLRTHRGLPITLVLIYKCVAERVGLTVRGINSPGHFLAAVFNDTPHGPELAGDAWMYVDPFYGGEILKPDEVRRRISEAAGVSLPGGLESIAPASHGQWLARMLNNLQAVFAHSGRVRDLYAMQELQELLCE